MITLWMIPKQSFQGSPAGALVRYKYISCSIKKWFDYQILITQLLQDLVCFSSTSQLLVFNQAVSMLVDKTIKKNIIAEFL